MSKKTDEELIKIVSTDRYKYNSIAISDAENEIRNRNIDLDLNQFKEDESYDDLTKNEQTNVELINRFWNYIIDKFFIFLISFIIIFIVNKGNLNDQSNELNDWAHTFILIAVSIIYYISLEYYFNKSIGKYFSNTIVVNLDGTKPNFETIIFRTLSRFIPFDALSFLFGDTGFHDRFSDTKLIKSN